MPTERVAMRHVRGMLRLTREAGLIDAPRLMPSPADTYVFARWSLRKVGLSAGSGNLDRGISGISA